MLFMLLKYVLMEIICEFLSRTVFGSFVFFSL